METNGRTADSEGRGLSIVVAGEDCELGQEILRALLYVSQQQNWRVSALRQDTQPTSSGPGSRIGYQAINVDFASEDSLVEALHGADADVVISTLSSYSPAIPSSSSGDQPQASPTSYGITLETILTDAIITTSSDVLARPHIERGPIFFLNFAGTPVDVLNPEALNLILSAAIKLKAKVLRGGTMTHSEVESGNEVQDLERRVTFAEQLHALAYTDSGSFEYCTLLPGLVLDSRTRSSDPLLHGYPPGGQTDTSSSDSGTICVSSPGLVGRAVVEILRKKFRRPSSPFSKEHEEVINERVWVAEARVPADELRRRVTTEATRSTGKDTSVQGPDLHSVGNPDEAGSILERLIQKHCADGGEEALTFGDSAGSTTGLQRRGIDEIL